MSLPDECANPECRRFIGGEGYGDAFRSEQDSRYCHDCGDLFWSFQPRSADHPYRIDPDNAYEGVQVSAEQCDNCGGDSYTLGVSSRVQDRALWSSAYARCDSCGFKWPLVRRPGRLIVW